MTPPASPRTKIDLPELRDARPRLSGFRRRHRAADRQTAAKLLASTLANAGVDLEPLGALRSQRQAAARERIARIEAEAYARSSAAQSSVEYATEAWRNSIGTLTTLQLPPNTQRLLLDTASEIATTPGLAPVAKHIGPQNNSAQFHLESTKESGFEEVDFGFLWHNPSDQWALVNVNGYLVLNGICQIVVSSGFGLGDIFGADHSDIEIRAFLQIHQLWNSPPTSPTWQPSQYQSVLQLELHNPGPFSGGDISSENFFRGFDLQYSMLAVPPHAAAGFEIICDIFYDNDDGEVNLIFSNDGRQVLCPGVLLTVLS